ncbi:S-adenosyl-L-methionine-dependent methyltransferase [Xylariaceae sp. FL0016]|nr:S-adenosyl-L-methionine-dependent methyltransferase [Xylariaceae sp. FL0016]
MDENGDQTLSKLQQLGVLIQSAIASYTQHIDGEESLPSRPCFDAERTLLSASGLLTELVGSPSKRLLEVSMQYFEARALHLVASQRIPDLLAKAGEEGVDLNTIAAASGVEALKLGRVLRCLCSIHIFDEVRPDCFTNNRISAALVGNEPLRAYILLFGLDLFSASDCLPKTLLDPEKGPSYDVARTPWQDAVGTTKARWEWLEETPETHVLRKPFSSGEAGSSSYPGPFGAVLDEATNGRLPDDQIARPEHQIFGLAMLGGGRVFGEAQLYDFPWASLGKATVVDVGGGVGGFCLQLSRIYPDLRFIVQDRAPVLAQAQRDVWPRENAAALESGRVGFVPHDFFDTNPTEAAEIYWLRYIIHDWADDYCVKILSAIKRSMGPKSRILICDQVMNTTLGSDELPSAPSPLPANWGYYTRYSHNRDLAMMAIINGIERKPAEFRSLAEAAGLKLRKIWDCRSQVGIVEMTLPNSSL